MFILTVLFIIVVIAAFKSNQKTQGEITQTINSLPNIYLQSRGMSGLVRTLNLAFEDSSILHSFTYENGIVTLLMKDGTTLKAPLSQLEVSYGTYIKIPQMTIKSYNQKVTVIACDNFNKHEWNVILRTMALARKTSGSALVLDFNASNTQANIQKILKELNRIG